MALYCQIGRTDGTGKVDYGPSGNETLMSLHVEVSGPFTVGSASLEIKDEASGFDIRARDMVQIYESSDAGVTISNRIFLGFVEETEQQVMATRSTYVKWLVKCQDANILWDWHRQQVITGQGITDGGVLGFDDQLQRISRAVATNNVAGSPVWDDVSGMALTANLTTDITFDYKGMSLRDMFSKRMKAYQASYSTSRPRFFMGYQTTGGASVYLPMMNVYDETTLLAAAAKYTFSTAPTGAEKNILSGTLKRTRQGSNLTTSVQATSFTNGGTVRQRANSGNISTYPNYFDQRPLGGGATPLYAWEGPLLKVEDGATNAQCLNIATEEISVSENPAEVFTFQSDDTLATGLLPGDTIAITSTGELGLTAYKRVVSNVEVDYIQRTGGTFIVRRTITAGNQLLELGDDDRRITSAVQEGDNVPPEAPSSLTGSVLIANGRAHIWLDWVLSVSADVVDQRLYTIINGLQTWRSIGATAIEDYVVIPYGQTYTIWVTAIDGSGHESDPSNTVTSSGVDRPPDPTLYNPDFTIADDIDQTQAEGWIFTPYGGGTGARVLASSVSASISGQYVYQITMPAVVGDGGDIASHKTSTIDTTDATVSAVVARYFRVVLQSPAAHGDYEVTAKFYDQNDVFIITQSVGSGSLTAGYTLVENSFAVAGAAYVIMTVIITSDGTANTCWVSGCQVYDVVATNQIKNLAITTAKIAASAVTSTRLATGAVTAGKIATGGISASTQFAAGVVNSAALASAAVTAGKIGTGGISAAGQFAAGVVDSAAIGSGAVTDTKLGTITDSSKFHLQQESATPRDIYDSTSAIRGREYYNTSNFLEYKGVNTGGTGVGVKVSESSGAALMFLDHNGGAPTATLQAAAGNNLIITSTTATLSGGSAAVLAMSSTKAQFSGTSVAITDAVLATGATGKFLYLPYMNGTPSGLPGAITGGAPCVWDDTNKKLYVYSVGAAAWKSVTLT